MSIGLCDTKFGAIPLQNTELARFKQLFILPISRYRLCRDVKLTEEQQMNATTTAVEHMENTDVTASNPSDNPEQIFEQYSIPVHSADSFPELKILTTESPAFRIHVSSN